MTAPINVGAGSSEVPVVQEITGLTPQTTYYFRVVAENSFGPVQGDILPLVTRSTVTLRWDVREDWTDAANPNGVWTYIVGGQTAPDAGFRGSDSFAPPSPPHVWGQNDFWGWSRSIGTELSIAPTEVIEGDVYGHTLGGGADDLALVWTSPISGEIVVSGGVWAARDIGRTNNWAVTVNGVQQASGTVTSGDTTTRDNPSSFGFTSNVLPSDVVKLSVEDASSGIGDYVGVSFTITANTVVTNTSIKTGGITVAPDLPGTTTFLSFTAPEIGVSGGRIRTQDGRTLDAVFNEQGEVLLHGEQVVPIDPNGGGEMGTIAKLMPPTGNAVLATLARGAGVMADNDQVLFTGLLSDDPQPAVRTGQDVPNEAGAQLRSFITVDGNGPVTFFLGTLKGDLSGGRTTVAVFATGPDPVGFRMLVRKGQMVGTKTVRTIATLIGQAGTLAEGRWRGGPESLGVRLTFTDRTQALYLIPATADGSDDWLLIGQTGDDAAPDLPGAELKSFQLPAYAPGATIFDSLLRIGPGGIKRKNSRAVFDALGVETRGPISLKLLAQVAGPAPAQSNMQRFLNTLAGLGRASTLIANATLPGQAGSRSTIFDAREDGMLVPIARIGGDAPGGGRFSRFVSVAKPDGQGYGALVSALLGVNRAAGVSPKNRAVLFARDSKGELRRVLRAGDMLQSAGPGSALKTVRSFVALAAAPGSIGAARGYDANGRVNMLVTFTDRTQAVVSIQVP